MQGAKDRSNSYMKESSREPRYPEFYTKKSYNLSPYISITQKKAFGDGKVLHKKIIGFF